MAKDGLKKMTDTFKYFLETSSASAKLEMKRIAT